MVTGTQRFAASSSAALIDGVGTKYALAIRISERARPISLR
jgi:DNA-directed RNA polymerase subunit K/omega